eukprot:263751_1
MTSQKLFGVGIKDTKCPNQSNDTDQNDVVSQKYWELKSLFKPAIAPSPFVINGIHGGNIYIVYLIIDGFIRKIENHKVIPKVMNQLCLKYYYIANKIIYSTYYPTLFYGVQYNENDCGIFEYDINDDKQKIITLWKDINIYPQNYCMIYHQQKLIFVGGRDQKNEKDIYGYNFMMEYDLKTKTLKNIVKINEILETRKSPHLYIGEDGNLHIVGGGRNKCHLKFNFESNKMIVINDKFTKER